MLKQTIIFAAIAGLVLALAPAAQAMEWVTVGDTTNVNDDTGYGAVAYNYNIGKYEVTNTQYAEFLTAVVGAGPDTYGLFNGSMQITAAAGVYTATVGNENKPVDWVCWYDAIRLANWMTAGATESGSYTITGGGANSGDVTVPTAAQRAAWAADGDTYVLLASEDEWYKAAYFDPNHGGAGVPGYWDYPTGSDTAPTPVTSGTASGTAVYDIASEPADVDNCGGLSAYDTMGQGGNVWEWTDTLVGTRNRVIRGGSWNFAAITLHVSCRDQEYIWEVDRLGFRVSQVVPEPATLAMLLLGLPFVMRRKRR